MVKINEIRHVCNLCFSGDEVIIVGNSNYTGKGIKSKVDFGVRPTVCLRDKVLVQKEQFGEIDVFELNGNLCDKLDLGFNLYSPFIWNDNLVLVSKRTRTYWSIDKDIKLKDLCFYKQYNFQIENQFYHIENHGGVYYLAQYNFKESISNWKFKLPSNIVINSGQKPVGDENNVYIPLENGLLCINSSSGKEIWRIDSTHSFDVDDLLVQNRGNSIVRIDKVTGEELESLNYDETPELKGFRSTGPIWNFDKYVCITNTLLGVVCIIKKNQFSEIETFNLGVKIPNDRKAIKMNSSELYILDSNNNLHILEIKDQDA